MLVCKCLGIIGGKQAIRHAPWIDTKKFVDQRVGSDGTVKRRLRGESIGSGPATYVLKSLGFEIAHAVAGQGLGGFFVHPNFDLPHGERNQARRLRTRRSVRRASPP